MSTSTTPRVPSGYKFVSRAVPPERITINFNDPRALSTFVNDVSTRQRAVLKNDDPRLAAYLELVEMVNADPAKAKPWDGRELRLGVHENRAERRANEKARKKATKLLEQDQAALARRNESSTSGPQRAPILTPGMGTWHGVTSAQDGTTTYTHGAFSCPGCADGSCKARRVFITNFFATDAVEEIVNNMVRMQTEAGAEAIAFDYWGVVGDERGY